MSESQSENLKCWFCGNDSYSVVMGGNQQILFLRCSKCSELYFVGSGIKPEEMRKCRDCHFWEKPIKIRKSYCSEHNSYYKADDHCSAWTKRNGIMPSVKPSETSDKQTEIENENSGSILGSGANSSNKT